MKKINNRGFAISTLLYGILMLVVLILTITLSVMRSSHTKKNIATDEILFYLNKCSVKEATLERCYLENSKDSTTTCNEEYSAYTECMGVEEKKTETGSEILPIKRVIPEKATKDPNETNRYIFKGSNPNNYIQIGTLSGRIISLESNGTTKVLLNETYDYNGKYTNNSAGAESSSDLWSNSEILKSFKNTFDSWKNSADIEIMNTIEKISEKPISHFGTTETDNDETTKSIPKIISYKNLKEDINKETTDRYRYGLPSIYDYLNASTCTLSDSTTINDTLIQSTCYGNNWMALDGCGWTSTAHLYNSATLYHITYGSGGSTKKSSAGKCKASMVIYLVSSTRVSGTGSNTDPYVVYIKK